MEVSLLARAVARNLNLNEELTEAICMGHDVGHAPFGHLGEATLAEASGTGFRHNRQSVRVIELLENNGKGLNLTWEVRQGILRHSKGRGGIEGQAAEGLDTLEGQIAKIADALAYVSHDTEDAIRAGMITAGDIPATVTRVLGATRQEWIATLVRDLTEASWAAGGQAAPGGNGAPPVIRMSPAVSAAANELRDFLFKRVYEPASATEQAERARDTIRLLYRHFLAHPSSVPDDYSIAGEPPERRTLDYISGMTDGYALLVAEAVKPGCTKGFWEQGVPLSLPR
jgi:dGTPase